MYEKYFVDFVDERVSKYKAEYFFSVGIILIFLLLAEGFN